MSKLKNPPLGSDFGNQRPQNPAVGPSVGSTGLQSPIGPFGKAGLQNPPVGRGVGSTALRNPSLEFVMEPQRQQYKGHRIELRERTVLELLINDQPIRYGQLPDGSYALEEYAYEPSHNLIDLAKRFIDYRDRVEETRRKLGAR
ncbi:MAG TPA: hypothetical protein VMT72_10530 [Pseudolabrys sp.]|nr:hypothetical protein [Pseudolabrys sp.]